MSAIQRRVEETEIVASFNLDSVKLVLATLRDVSSIKRIRDQSAAMKTYLRQQKDSKELQLDAAECFMWASRRLGEVLEGTEHLGQGGDRKSSSAMQLDRLSDIHITKTQSSRWQAVAAVPELRLHGYIDRMRGEGKEPTVSGLLSDERAIAREQARQDAISSIGDDDQDESGTVTVCSIEHLEIEPGSVDMVFTDPPYHDEYIQLYEQLGEVAAQALKPGGFCLVYAGKMYLPQLFTALSSHLEYFWQFAVFHPFSKARVNSRAIFENYRPVLAFRKAGGSVQGPRWISDVVRGTRDGEHKAHHEWQQDEDAPRQYIEAYTEPGAVVLDPFSGGGTTAAVCKSIGRRFLCFDADERSVKLSLSRLKTLNLKEDVA